MDLGLRGRTALVTGATRGIGRACASSLAKEGARVVLFSRSGEKLREVAADIQSQFEVDVIPVQGDMTRPDDVQKLKSDLVELCGGPDILVLNTGRPPLNLREVLDENDPERWESAFQTQLSGAIGILSNIAPLMVKRKYGRIVAITSASVKQPMPRHGLSTVFRAGVAGYLKHLANEIAPHGVTVNSVLPASIATEGFLGSFDPDARIKMIPLGRLGTPVECASIVTFLASAQAGFITGTSIPVDGGMVGALT